MAQLLTCFRTVENVDVYFYASGYTKISIVFIDFDLTRLCYFLSASLKESLSLENHSLRVLLQGR